MRIQLEVVGEVDGRPLTFTKCIDNALAIPRIGETVHLGVNSGASPHLNERTVIRVEWSPSLDSVQVTLDDLHEAWLHANRRAFHDAGWNAFLAAEA